uniref:Uncharacterized protein n=1 Tax=Rhizophora mucronata TaxID=61149 RepID=A0A2P2L2I6_RHIMU
MFYLSTLCDDADQGKKLLNAAMNALFIFPGLVNCESGSTVTSDNAGEIRPTLLWRAFYIQELNMMRRCWLDFGCFLLHYRINLIQSALLQCLMEI